ncbi:S-layer homology domain-containing protein [Domibacillus indicus]|uniref:S-layer homology domain-containing protein n=1 Tax=Domibacillus indicus TaxID=1437523 RepID=UPI002041B31A|nr:S-layer homology domain-containing protein [Domibacillus indicus]MCM3788868.1 S-layer homology domain-containing protein [Domibacillus indicus]
MAYQPKSYRKFVATAATATLVATAVTPAFAAETGAAASFTDVPERYKEAVDYLVDNKITLGVSEDKFGTTQSIKRVDAAVMIAKALEIEIADRPDSGFTDVPERAVAYVDALKAEGIINGKTATTFGSEQSITRGEIALILANAYDLNGTSDKQFSDVSSRYADAVEALVAAGITKGKTDTTFGTTDAITRGEFAIFLHRAELLPIEKTPAVTSASAVAGQEAVTISGKVANASTASIVILDSNGQEVYDQDVTVSEDGSFTRTINLPVGNYVYEVRAIEGEEVSEVKAGNFSVTALNAEVVSANAANAKEVKVVFNKAVDKTTAENPANYTVAITGATAPVSGLTADLQADGRTVILSAAGGADIFTNGNAYTVEVKNVLSKDLSKVVDFKTATLNYFDNTVPTVVSSELNGSNVRVYFNEPVTNVTLKVDGGVVLPSSSTLSSTNVDGQYYVEVPATTDTSKAGNHSVTVYGATDGDGNTLQVSATQYTVLADTVAPSVVSVTPESSNVFDVKVSEKLAVVPTFEVKKGGVIFPITATNVAVDPDDPTGLTYEVTVPTTGTGGYNLYGTNENTAALSVKITNIKDNSNLTGAEYNGTVTLTKDAVGPKVLSANTNTVSASGVISVKFDENISLVDASKVKVYKNGILLSATPSVTGPTDTLTITLPSTEAGTVATYNVRLEPGAVEDASGNDNVTLATTAAYTDSTKIAATVTTPATNQFQVAYASTTDLTTSATSASNYTLDGKPLPTGTTLDFAGDKKTVLITLPTETVSTSTAGILQISKNVVNTAGQYVANADDTLEGGSVTLTDNVKPVLQSGKFVDADTNNRAESVELTFSENVSATAANDFEFTVNGAKVTPDTVTVSGGKVVAAFTTTANQVNTAQALVVKVLPTADQTGGTGQVMDTQDAAGNKLTASTTITVNTVK